MAKPKTPLSTRIREYQTTHPNASAKDIAAKFKTTAGYIYAIRNSDKNKDWKTVSLSTSDKPLNHTITMMEDDLTKLTDEQLERMAHNLGKSRIRMQGAPLPVTKSWEEQNAAQADNVNHPAHYKVGGIETIDFIEAKGFGYNLGNAVKYISRAEHKGNFREDLLKARWYIERELRKTVKL